MKRISPLLLCLLALVAAGRPGAAARDKEPPVTDARWAHVRTNDEGIHFEPYRDRAAWLRRRQALREQVLVACGLWPLTDRSPLRTQVYGRLDRDGYTIEKVVIETLPGFYLTGNLYRPKGPAGRRPGILSPHGHWQGGRFEEWVQGRCIGLARLGGVVLVYDMVGYGDGSPFGHSFQNDALRLLGLDLAGLQLWNSLCALDFVCGLPDVDPARIACTGESGGGTQTFLLTAVDDRIQVGAPVCMVSHTFQGGCECENAPSLRLDTDNVELAAAFAPKPMILIGATGDWTKELLTHGYPEIRSTYRLLGREENVRAAVFDAPHNYNRDSREAVYTWFARHLFQLPDTGPVHERPYTVDTPETLSCWDAAHPRPAEAAAPAQLQSTLTRMVEDQAASLSPAEAKDWLSARAAVRTGLRHLLGAELPPDGSLRVEELGKGGGADGPFVRLRLGRVRRGDQVPAALYVPTNGASGDGVVIVHPGGSAALGTAGGEPNPLITALRAAGRTILAIDAFRTGEHLGPGEPPARATPAHFFTYNRSLLAERVQDVLTAAAYLRARPGIRSVSVVGLKEAGPWCLLARALTEGIDRLAVDANAFEFPPSLPSTDPMFSPGMRRYGGLGMAAALAAPSPLLLSNTGTALDPAWCARAYAREGAEGSLIVRQGGVTGTELAAWLIR